MELRSALEHPNPTEYESALPVHQDGTCNGLQHYAALGGDDQGARQVNLSVTDRPSDVYTYVADMVEKMLEEGVKKGEKHALMLHGMISRKVVKQTVSVVLPFSWRVLLSWYCCKVMTTVYGVTFVGAREQIERQLRDKNVAEEDCWGASAYLAKKVTIPFFVAEINQWPSAFRSSLASVTSSAVPEAFKHGSISAPGS
jgi:DNA-directed RNA polymerase